MTAFKKESHHLDLKSASPSKRDQLKMLQNRMERIFFILSSTLAAYVGSGVLRFSRRLGRPSHAEKLLLSQDILRRKNEAVLLLQHSR